MRAYSFVNYNELDSELAVVRRIGGIIRDNAMMSMDALLSVEEINCILTVTVNSSNPDCKDEEIYPVSLLFLIPSEEFKDVIFEGEVYSYNKKTGKVKNGTEELISSLSKLMSQQDVKSFATSLNYQIPEDFEIEDGDAESVSINCRVSQLKMTKVMYKCHHKTYDLLIADLSGGKWFFYEKIPGLFSDSRLWNSDELTNPFKQMSSEEIKAFSKSLRH